MSDADDVPRISRREALTKVGGGLTVLGAGIVVGAVGTGAAAATDDGHGGPVEYEGPRVSGDLPTGAAAGPYGGEYAAPEEMVAGDLDALTYPPPAPTGTVEIEMTVVERSLRVSRAHTVEAWTYNGAAPGPRMGATS